MCVKLLILGAQNFECNFKPTFDYFSFHLRFKILTLEIPYYAHIC